MTRLGARSAGLAFTLAALALTGCARGVIEENAAEPPNAADAVRAADLSPKSPLRGASVPSTSMSYAGFAGFSAFGSAAPPAAGALANVSTEPTGSVSAPEAPRPPDDGLLLNFENAPIAAVVKSVLGDMLGLNYVLDSRAQGTISLSSSRAAPKKQLLFILESALKANNLTMIREGGVYRIAPANEGVTGALERGANDAGFGVTAIPLANVSAATMIRLLEGFAARPGSLRADPSGSVLVVTGGGAERQAALETARSFDVDWLRGQSVGLYPVRNSEAEPIVAALEKIMDSGEGGFGHGLVKLQAIARQSAILVVSARPDLLRAASNWIHKLDFPNAAAQTVHVYKVHYGEARQISELLKSMFGGAGGGSAEAANSQLSPSSGETALSPSERLTGGRARNGAGAELAPVGAGAGASPKPASSPFGGMETAMLANAMNGGAAFPGLRITADTSNNSVVVYANAQNYATIERALIQLDRPKAQVAIDVTIAEVKLNDSLNYGVQVYLRNALGGVVNSATGQPTTSANAPSGFNILVGSGATPRAIINALHEVTDVRILSNPSLVVQENQEASLEVGNQVPVSTGSATVLTTSNTVVNTTDYKNTGILLHVMPRISPDNTVSLAIDQEISNVPNAELSSLTPTISERKVKSAVSIASGQMVMLAGLIADEQDKSRAGVPGLSQLPWIGGAFGTTGKSHERTELIILIRPQVIRNGVDAADVAEQLRAKMTAGRVPALSLRGALNINTREY